MKRTVFLLILLSSVVNLSGQTETDKNNIRGVHIALGKGNFGWRELMAGGGGYENKYYYTLGIDYSRKLFKRVDLCTGIEYTCNYMTSLVYNSPQSNEYLKLLTIPAQFKYHIGKLVYFNGGLFVNVLAKTSEERWVASRDGKWVYTNNVSMLLGWGLGAGIEHEFEGVVFSLNPYVRWNGIGGVESFYKAQYEGFIFSQIGVNFGLGYKF